MSNLSMMTALIAGGALLVSGGCTLLPASGPASHDVVSTQSTSPDSLPFSLIRLTPDAIELLAANRPRFARVFSSRPGPSEIRFGTGDVVSVTIFEASAGGLFIPIEAGVRPGNFITLPNQLVDNAGNISVPYAGAIQAKGRTSIEVQQAIIDALRNRAIEPQAVVTLVEQRTSLISVLGDVNVPARFPANREGERLLDAITRGGGPRSQGFDSWVMLERDGRRATLPFGALVYEPANNIYVRPNDTIYVYREPQTFLAFGAYAQQGAQQGAQGGQFPFDQWRLSLAEAVAKAGGMNDARADPASVFVYRGEPRKLVEQLGGDPSKNEGPIVPVIYQVNFRDPAGFFIASQFQMRNKDVIYISNAVAIESAKLMQYIRLVSATVNDPMVVTQNAVVLRNTLRDGAPSAGVTSIGQ